HIDDIVGLLLFALDNPEARGPINGTSPNPVRNADFAKALARALHRPRLPIGPPDSLLQVVLGEVAQVITKGQKVLPRRAQELGYKFQHPELDEALRDLFTKRPAPKPEPAPQKHAASAGHDH